MTGKGWIGEDGWPISSPKHEISFKEWSDNRFQREMRASEQALNNGNFVVLDRAIKACRTHRKPMPDWLASALIAVVHDYVRDGKALKSAGRKGNPLSAYKHNQIHFARWSEVEHLRSNWALHPERLKKKPSLEKAYGMASQETEGLPHAGDSETFKKSYQKVERLTRQGDGGVFVQK